MSKWKWRPVVGQEGKYEVSETGEVRRLRHRNARGHWVPTRTMKQSTGNNGYARVSVGSAGVRLVHHLVAEAFLGPRPPAAHVRHLDTNKRNNSVTNLAYGSPSENMGDTLAHGKHKQASQTHCKHGHEFTPGNTRVFTRRNGRTQRDCRTCYREYRRAKYKAERGEAYGGRF